MTYGSNHTIPEDVLELIASQGMEAVTELIRRLINQAMLIRREQHLGAAPYRRSPSCSGHANSFKSKTI